MKHTTVMKTNNIKAFSLGLVTLLLSLSATIWAADVTPSVTLTSYYSAANGKKADALRTALQGIIDDHTVVGYKSLGTLMQYSDTEEANGKDVVDIYTTCTFTVSGALTWASSGSVGDGMNREHTVPQSWFSEASPMVSDAFHIYPTDCKANNNRSSYLYGEFTGAGTSYSSSKCSESGKLSSTGTKSIASYTVSGKTYTPTATYSGQVYEPADEYKGDIARGYFYMATRYADKCSSWSGGAFGSDNNGFKNYTAELMLKWHRQDPVSRKELIRNEVIYGNSTYNKSSLKQGNRNPFIDYPELVEYIWGDKKDQNVNINDLTSGYAEAGTGTPTSTYNVTLYRMGAVQVLTGKSGTFVLPTDATEANACGDWKFAGWVTTAVSTATENKPTFITQVTGTSTLYAVYAKTESNGSAPRRAKMDASSATYTFTSSSWEATLNGSSANWASGKAGAGYSNSGVQVTTNASGANATCPTSYSNITSIVVSYCTNSSKGAGTINMTVDGNNVSNSVSTSGGTNARNLTFDFSGSTPTGAPQITVTCTTNSIYICGLTINYSSSGGGGGGSATYDSDPDDCHCTGNLATPTNVKATPSDGTITLTWTNDANATNGYTVTIGKGQGYTTECADPAEIGAVTLSGSTNTCVITGLVNGLEYTASVVANATATTCESTAGTATATPVGCESWADPTVSYGSYSLTVGGGKTAAPTITGTTYGTATYKSSNEDVLQVDGTGRVTPLSAGTATVTVHWTGDETHCPKDVTTSLFTVTGLVRITFDANDGSATPATATQDVTYNVATALTAINTIGFSRTGYTFQGWSTDKNATSAAYTDGGNITITAATTLYAIWQVNKHSVTFTPSMTGATVKVNNNPTSPVSNVDFGSTVNIVVTPATHYSVGSVTANGGVTVTGSDNNWSFTMPDKDVEITVTMTEETKYTVNWYVNNIPTAEQNYAGSTLAGIGTPSIDCNDKVFQGWTTTANYNSDNTAPTDLFTDPSTKTMPSNNDTKYYAVFATETTSGSSTVYKLVENLTNGKDYVFVTRNTVGSGYAFSSAITTGTSVTIAESGSDKIVSGTPADAIIWTAATGWSLTTKDATKTNKVLKINGSTFALDATGSNNLTWTTNFGLNGQSGNGNTKYYLQCTSDGTFSKSTTTGSSTNRVWAYEKTGGGQTTTYTDYTTSCTTPTEVTVTFNANGGTGTMADQNVPYNTATALTANSFSRTGYHFAGWATTADGTKVYDDEESVTLTKNLNLFALWTKNTYKVYFTPDMTGQASVTVNGASTSPQSVEFGGAVNIVINPDVAYTVSSVTATGGVTPTGSGNNWSFNMPASDVTVTVSLTPKQTYAIRFFNMGTQVGETQNLYAGATATVPSSQAACEGYTFLGWWTAALAEDNTESHTWVVSDFTVTGAQDYYAVYSHTEGGGGGSSTSVTKAMSTFTAISGNVDSDENISYEAAKGGASTEPAIYSDEIRIYQGGGLLTVSANNGKKITAVTIGSSMATSVTYAIDGGDESDDQDISAGETLSLSGLNASSIVYTCTGADKNHRLYLNYISVTYSDGGSGSTTTTYYTTAPNCVECTNKVTLEKGTPSNGSFSLNKTGEQDNCSSDGLVVTVTDIEPATGYRFKEITQSGINSGVTINNNAKTVTYAQDVTGTSTINVVFEALPTYTIRFYNNGALVGSAQIVTEGQSAVKPSTDPTTCDEKYTFVGWWTAELDADNTTAETWITDFTATKDQDYYAVYRYTETNGGGSSTITLDASTDTSFPKDGITLTTSNGVLDNGTDYRIYKGATLTITSSVGDMTSIAFTFDGSYNGGGWETSYTPNSDTWTSPACTSGNSGKQARIKQIVITIGGGGSTTTYYTTAPDCEAPIVTSAKMLVAEFGGARVALAHDNTNTVAALPLMYFGGNYFCPNLDKNGNTASAPEKATLTWQVAERTDGYYIKSDDNKFLAQTEGEFALDKEKFLWPKSGALRLAYDAATEAFVVAAGEKGELPGITPVDVPSTISTTELKSQRDLTIGKFGTICLPHAVALPFTWGVKVYSVDGVKMSNDVLSGIYLVEETEMLVAGKPYLIEAVATQMNMWYATGAPTADKVVEAVGLVGNLDASPIMYAPIGEYIYILLDNQLRRVGEGAKAKIGQYKAYFDLEDVGAPDALPQAHAYKVMYVEDSEQVATDVSETPATINWDEPVYNILGMRVDRNATGVLIQGGTKFIIRVP